MKDVLKYVVGFRTDKKWKKVIASVYYVFCLLILLAVGIGAFLVVVTIPFIIFAIIDVIKNENKKKFVIIGLSGILLFSLGMKMDNTRQAEEVKKEHMTAQIKVITDKKAIEDAKAKVISDARDKVIADAQAIENKKLADAQAIKDKETARLKAIEDKKVALAKVEAEKVAYDTGITYDQLARTPDKYKDKKVKFTGKVIQVTEEGKSTSLRVAIDDNYNTILLVIFKNSIIASRLLENDNITIKGVSQGVYTYDTVLGAKMTLPLVNADKISR